MEITAEARRQIKTLRKRGFSAGGISKHLDLPYRMVAKELGLVQIRPQERGSHVQVQADPR